MQRVLMIDDDPQVSSVLAMALETLGHEVVVSTQTEKTEELCTSVHPDLILLDMMMPGRSGLELIEPVTRLCPNAMICMMTGMIDEDLLRKSLAAGAWNVLYKPYSLAELAELLELSTLLSDAIRAEKDTAADAPPEAVLHFAGNEPYGAQDIQKLVHAARGLGSPDDVAFRRLPVVAVELLENARVHGAKADAAKSYTASLGGAASGVELIVADTGEGFDWKRCSSGLSAKILGGGAPGLQIVRSLADQLNFAEHGRVVSALFRA